MSSGVINFLFKKNFLWTFFPLRLFILNIFFKIDDITLDPDPNWAKILEPDPEPNSMFLDPQPCSGTNHIKFSWSVQWIFILRPSSNWTVSPLWIPLLPIVSLEEGEGIVEVLDDVGLGGELFDEHTLPPHQLSHTQRAINKGSQLFHCTRKRLHLTKSEGYPVRYLSVKRTSLKRIAETS